MNPLKNLAFNKCQEKLKLIRLFLSAFGSWRLIRALFASFSMQFTVVTIVTFFYPSVPLTSPYILGAMAIMALAWGASQAWRPLRVNIPIQHTNTKIEIVFGNFFNQVGLNAISVTEYFDSKIGRPVSKTSLHGQFIQRFFRENIKSFDDAVDAELFNVEYTETDKTEGKKRAYPIGATALLQVNNKEYILFALAKAERESCKAYSNVSYLWIALSRLWERARIECGGKDVNVPLIGGGPSGIGLPARDLLNLIILSIIKESAKREITRKIRIVLHPDVFGDVNLAELKKYWG